MNTVLANNVVKGRVDTKPANKAVVALCQPARSRKCAAVRRSREQEGIGQQRNSERVSSGKALVTVIPQNCRCLRVEGDPTLLVSLQVPFAPTLVGTPDRAAQPHRLAADREVDSWPTEAQSSPRRAALVMAAQIKVPQSRSFHASVTIRAASSGLGGRGLGFGGAGGSPWSMGLTVT